MDENMMARFDERLKELVDNGKKRKNFLEDQEITEPFTVDSLGHTEPDAEGKCGRCGAQLTEPQTEPSTEPPTEPDQPHRSNLCKWCGEPHTGFWGKIVGIWHTIFYFWVHLFGLR